MKTCFVISPIGQDGSDIRKNADYLFELIIEPALEIYNDYKVIRGDMGTTVTSITDEVIKLIQNAELCIIDLSGHNPNVFYECGRRHETGKPFILIKRKGEEIPFDLKDIRTVDYDLSDPHKTRASINSLRKFVNEFEEIGYGSGTSVASLSSIANTLNRLERKLDTMGSSATGTGQSIEVNGISGSPAVVFYSSLKANDTATAVKALKRFMQISADINLQLDMASMLVEAYEPAGVPTVRNILDKDFDKLEPSKLTIALHGLYTYYVGAFVINDEYKYLKETTKKALQKQGLEDKDLAGFYNLLASIEYSMKNDLESLKYQEKTIELVPGEPAYNYNIAKIYQALNKNEELINSVENIIIIYKNKDLKKDKINLEYINYAREIMVKNKLADKVTEIDELVSNAKKYPESLTFGV